MFAERNRVKRLSSQELPPLLLVSRLPIGESRPTRPFPEMLIKSEARPSNPGQTTEQAKVVGIRREIAQVSEQPASPEPNGVLKEFMKEKEYATKLQSALFTPTDLDPKEYPGYALQYMKTVGKKTMKGGLAVAGVGLVNEFIHEPITQAIATTIAILWPYLLLTKKPLESLKTGVKTILTFGVQSASMKLKQKELTALYPDKNSIEIQQMAALEISLAKNKGAQKRIDDIQKEYPQMKRDQVLDIFIQQEYVKENRKELDLVRQEHPGSTDIELMQFNENKKFVRNNYKRIQNLRKKFPMLSDQQIFTIIQVDQLREQNRHGLVKVAIENYIKIGTTLGLSAFVLFLLPHLIAGSAAILTSVFAVLAVNFGRRVLISLLAAGMPTRMAWRQKKWMTKEADLSLEVQDDIKKTLEQLMEQ